VCVCQAHNDVVKKTPSPGNKYNPSSVGTDHSSTTDLRHNPSSLGTDYQISQFSYKQSKNKHNTSSVSMNRLPILY
jgi:hypothetical protein